MKRYVRFVNQTFSQPSSKQEMGGISRGSSGNTRKAPSEPHLNGRLYLLAKSFKSVCSKEKGSTCSFWIPSRRYPSCFLSNRPCALFDRSCSCFDQSCSLFGSVPQVRCFRLSWLVMSFMHAPNHELSGLVSILTAYVDPSRLNFTLKAWLCFEQSAGVVFDTTLASGTLSDIYSSTDAVDCSHSIWHSMSHIFWHSIWHTV